MKLIYGVLRGFGACAVPAGPVEQFPEVRVGHDDGLSLHDRLPIPARPHPQGGSTEGPVGEAIGHRPGGSPADSPSGGTAAMGTEEPWSGADAHMKVPLHWVPTEWQMSDVLTKGMCPRKGGDSWRAAASRPPGSSTSRSEALPTKSWLHFGAV